MGPLVAPLIGAGLGLLGAHFSGRAAAKAAKENRDFQERMSDTAHQREVRDLRAAGLNPILSANRGASSPSGATADTPDFSESMGRGVASALAVKQVQAAIELSQAQALESRTRAYDLQTQGASGRYEEIRSRADLANMNVEQQRKLFPLAIERAEAEIANLTASARRATLAGDLDELLRDGSAKNIAEFEKRMGEAGPGIRFLLDLLRAYNAMAGEPYRRSP